MSSAQGPSTDIGDFVMANLELPTLCLQHSHSGLSNLTCSFELVDLFSVQMSAYFAPAFFSYLLGKCLRRQNPLLEVLKLGFVVIGTFSIVWWPYLQSVDAFLQVIIFLLEFC